MVDRQDIDALLVGALYGELTPADEARLAAHLESHPADRAALDDLKTARQAVKQSRIFEVQDEPPQAVSALLLQEAHRRAPSIRSSAARGAEEREGWFARLTRSFFAHPAMAAAAMLVVVVGVAGTLYMRKGDQFANKEAAPTLTQGAAPSAATTPPASDNAMELDNGIAGAGAPGTGSGYAVQLDEGTAGREEMKQQLGKLESERAKLQTADKADGDAVAERQRQIAKSSKPTVTAHVPEPQPKDLAEPMKKAAPAKHSGSLSGDDFGGTRGATGGAGGPAGFRDQPAAMAPEAAPAPAAPPPPPKASANAITGADARTVAPAPGKNDAKSDPVSAWAQKQLAQAIELAKSDCRGAARIALDIRDKAPGFYKDNVADRRELKNCQVYIRGQEEQRTKKMSPAKTPDAEMMH